MICNLGRKVPDKFPNLSETNFSMERFTTDFCNFLTEKRQNLAFG